MNELDGRIRKSWWAVCEGRVQKVVGYSCAPHSPESWWCPQLGFTLTEKHHLFENEKQAIDKAVKDLSDEAKVILLKIEQLSKRKTA
jgi:hypothetical protein